MKNTLILFFYFLLLVLFTGCEKPIERQVFVHFSDVNNASLKTHWNLRRITLNEPLTASWLTASYQQEKLPFLTIYHPSNITNSTFINELLDGVWDEDLHFLFTTIKNAGYPIFISLFPNIVLDKQIPAKLYQDSYRYVINYAQSMGAYNTFNVFSLPMHHGEAINRFETHYPGNNVVDWIMLDQGDDVFSVNYFVDTINHLTLRSKHYLAAQINLTNAKVTEVEIHNFVKNSPALTAIFITNHGFTNENIKKWLTEPLYDHGIDHVQKTLPSH
ncbi:hypothetical protein DID76_02105 [Candidatus Marinamargulisbacteria bacterium SCGC AG-414-C22]|nr:hypothetical protein DID76_02105 [Candidatus Marinamargulisbacteria bacterium SCGC AG-414-C22]